MVMFILTILAKTVVVELAIELLRQAVYAVTHNMWAGSVLVGTNKNARYDFWLSCFESILVASMLILGYGMIFTTILIFIVMTVLKELGKKILIK